MAKKKVKKMEVLKSNEPTTISASSPLDIKSNEQESLTVEELQNILRAKSKAVQLTMLAEKAVSDARVAELEAQNIILLTYNKYQLNQFIGDKITEDGLIYRIRENGDNNGQ